MGVCIGPPPARERSGCAGLDIPSVAEGKVSLSLILLILPPPLPLKEETIAKGRRINIRKMEFQDVLNLPNKEKDLILELQRRVSLEGEMRKKKTWRWEGAE